MKIDPTIIQIAVEKFGTSPAGLKPLSGGYYQAVYEFDYAGKACVLRVATAEEPIELVLSRLEWAYW
jgi:hypothetical protein